jgi:hypothetical protein
MTAVVVKSHGQTANGITIPPVAKWDGLMDLAFMTHPVRTLDSMADYVQAHFEPRVFNTLIR